MSTTLHTHPPQPRQAEVGALTSRRPTALDRLALRLGLLLITYGRRRYAVSRDEVARLVQNRADQAARERDWERARWHLLPLR